MKRLSAMLLALVMLCSVFAMAMAEGTEDTFVPADYSAFNFIKKIPMKPKYIEAVEEKGTASVVTYTAHVAVSETETIEVEKQLMVYLPYNYDPAQNYNVLYLMHGGGEDEYYWLSDTRMGGPTCAMLDREIAKGECKPVIVVAPTNNYPTEDGVKQNRQFWKEIRDDIVPFIESTYATYANGDVSEANLIATREHRAFAGFSMGSIISMEAVMRHSLDYFAYIGSYSAGTSDHAGFLADVNSEAFKDLPIKFWYHGEGSADFALDGHIALRDFVLENMSDRLTDGENFCWVLFKGGTHAYNCWLPHTYNALRVFFQD